MVGASVASGIAGSLTDTVMSAAVAGHAPSVSQVAHGVAIGGVLGIVGAGPGKMMAAGLASMSRSAKGKRGKALTRANEALKGNVSTSPGKSEIPGSFTLTGSISHARFDDRFTNVFTGATKLGETKWGTSHLTRNLAAAIRAGVQVQITRHTPESVSGTASGAISGAAAAGATPDPDKSGR